MKSMTNQGRHHFVDPGVDDPIWQDFEITSIFGIQIDFSWYNP